eukprot:1252577-Rhodomonas_salina.2
MPVHNNRDANARETSNQYEHIGDGELTDAAEHTQLPGSVCILSFVTERHEAMLSERSVDLHTAGEDSNIWKELCHRDFGILMAGDDCTWRETYRMALVDKVVWCRGCPDYVELLHGYSAAPNAQYKTASRRNDA